MEKPAFTRAYLSYVKFIMAIMCVPLVELLCQAGIGWIPALKYLLPGERGTYGNVLSCQTINATTF
jgi:hypothetical protein